MNILYKKNLVKRFLKLQRRHSSLNSQKKEPKLATDVINYLENTPEYNGIKGILPKTLLRKYKSPENMYLINRKTAEKISNNVKNYIMPEDPVIEVNPGMGFLSEMLLKSINNKLYIYETSNHFSTHLYELRDQYPDRVTHKVADFFGMWKLAFQDKIDNGNRIKDLLGELCTDDNNRTVKIIGAMPGLNFIKHLVNNIVFHNTNNQLGKPDLFIIMPGYNYEFLTDHQIQTGKHKSMPSLFQLFFDYKILTSVPKVHFLPWTYPPNNKKLSVMDECNLYLVNITQKDKLPCPPEYLPLLWYFFKPHMFSMSTKVIPMLEQWIPGCGVWLISGQDPPDTNKNISPGEEDAELPHMTIFTEFRDLTLRQKLTVFKRFVSWPEFEQSPFKVTMENNLPKFIIPLEDDDKDSIGSHIEDMEHSDSDVDT
ncbi:unnamed protein product [Chilo suppressalis]|uniref:rRNA adenine N(6)-methyltransferase n=1 Tax=Chilo suppressalis TaxID=168631 RepID=A0ABN8AWF3_CHISP|nr:hypothetical protein evm_005295 [Chilo suppressalis]CAH0400513.1 unnamed protein product [Chilo suppressalis]